MKANLKMHTAIAVTCFGSLLSGGAAYADGWPTSVAGSWSATANQSSGTLSITQPPSNLDCKPISGTIFGSSLEGFYCPESGRISFARKSNGVTFQYYEANLSQQVRGRSLRMGGSFAAFPANGSGGSLGEYNFSATK